MNRKGIWIDSRYWKPEPVNEIVIDGVNTHYPKILTLCEVYVLGMFTLYFFYSLFLTKESILFSEAKNFVML